MITHTLNQNNQLTEGRWVGLRVGLPGFSFPAASSSVGDWLGFCVGVSDFSIAPVCVGDPVGTTE